MDLVVYYNQVLVNLSVLIGTLFQVEYNSNWLLIILNIQVINITLLCKLISINCVLQDYITLSLGVPKPTKSQQEDGQNNVNKILTVMVLTTLLPESVLVITRIFMVTVIVKVSTVKQIIWHQHIKKVSKEISIVVTLMKSTHILLLIMPYVQNKILVGINLHLIVLWELVILALAFKDKNI